MIFAIVGFVEKVGHPGWKSGEWFEKTNAEEDAPKVEYIYIENSSSNGNIGSVSDEPEAPQFSSEIWYAVETSANSNGNFIADLGGHGKGAVIPNEAIDLKGKTWPIGRVLLTYCETASNCFYAFGEPGDVLSRAFNVNAYTPQFDGDLANELQWVDVGWNNNNNVQWTYINN